MRLPLALCLLLTAAATTTPVVAQRRVNVHPDFQGFWTNGTMTPLERPVEFGDKTHFTAGEAAEYERTFLERGRKRLGDSFVELQADYNEIWLELMKVDRLRTSLIVDPPSGRLPARVPAAQARIAKRPPTSYDDPEGLPLIERCLVGNRGSDNSPASPPMIPNNAVSSYYQFVQTDDTLLIMAEWMHDARIIRINGTHLPATLAQWLGDSVGHWEDSTLVVETTNFRRDTRNQESSERLRVVERFSRPDAETIQYRVTAEDPETWATPWTAEIPFKATANRMFEYACQEANYSLGFSLRGARAAERRLRER
jgi:hypothetical protein